MAAANTTSDTMPTTWGGPRLVKGKKNPVTLVNTVVNRKSAVQPGEPLPPSQPNRTTAPEKIPIKLMITCSVVNVAVDNPKIMARFPPVAPRVPIGAGPTQQIARPAERPAPKQA